MSAKTAARNREIFAGFIAGKTTGQLTQTYRLSRQTINAIVASERHRLQVSTDEFYEGQRAALGLRPWVKL